MRAAHRRLYAAERWADMTPEERIWPKLYPEEPPEPFRQTCPHCDELLEDWREECPLCGANLTKHSRHLWTIPGKRHRGR